MNYKFLYLLAAALCCGFSCENTYLKEIENPYIRFVNQSDDTVWVEMLSPYEITDYYYKESIEDSFFYGETYWPTGPHTVRQIRMSQALVEEPYEPFAVRIFVMDYDSPINIDHARFDYYKKQCGMDSLQVIQYLKEFEQNHLLYKHWYSKEELDSLNWTIVYPQKR